MIIFPRENPVIRNLNSYYIQIDKLIEHYQGELEACCIYFKSSSIEAAIYFEEDSLFTGTVIDKTGKVITGKQSIDHIVTASGKTNFAISVYKLEVGTVYFWASLAKSTDLYKDLSSEFTDLEGLIQKMQSEKLIGYIDVTFNDQKNKGYIFFINGMLIGCLYSGAKGGLSNSAENQKLLIEKTREAKAVFNVKKVALMEAESRGKAKQEPKAEASGQVSPRVLEMNQELLKIFESTAMHSKRIRDQFDTLLKRKFMEQADHYSFLDPFAAEFQYTGGQIQFSGKCADDIFSKGIADCVRSMAQDFNIIKYVKQNLAPWEEKYANEIKRFGISF